MIKEHEQVVLTTDLRAEDLPSGLAAGDIGTVVHVHKGGTAYEVEFMTMLGNTIAVETLSERQVRPISERDVAHVRELERV